MKIQIIGFSGAGKSTLSKQLSKFHNLPVIHMDSLNFLDNWFERDRIEFNNMVNEFLDANDSARARIIQFTTISGIKIPKDA